MPTVDQAWQCAAFAALVVGVGAAMLVVLRRERRRADRQAALDRLDRVCGAGPRRPGRANGAHGPAALPGLPARDTRVEARRHAAHAPLSGRSVEAPDPAPRPAAGRG
jgi:chloramphenicol 3-O-phosphotransferase